MPFFHHKNSLVPRNNNAIERHSFFDDFENEFFNHPLISFPSFYPTEALENQISKHFDSDLFKSTMNFNPKLDLGEDENNYYIHADLEGINKDQVKMELLNDNHTLIITGERKIMIDNSNPNENESEDKNNKKHKKGSKKENNKKAGKIECSYAKFERDIIIPDNADINNIHAKMENGILDINIPKIEVQKQEPKRLIHIE